MQAEQFYRLGAPAPIKDGVSERFREDLKSNPLAHIVYVRMYYLSHTTLESHSYQRRMYTLGAQNGRSVIK